MRLWFKEVRSATLIWGLGVLFIMAKQIPLFYELGVGFFVGWLLHRRGFAVSLLGLFLLIFLCAVVIAGLACVDVCVQGFDSPFFWRDFLSALELRIPAGAIPSLALLVVSMIVTSVLLRRFSSEK